VRGGVTGKRAVGTLVNFKPGPLRQVMAGSVEQLKGFRVKFYVKDFRPVLIQVKAIPDFYDVHIFLAQVEEIRKIFYYSRSYFFILNSKLSFKEYRKNKLKTRNNCY
jgi:hypothetical protein